VGANNSIAVARKKPGNVQVNGGDNQQAREIAPLELF
jgi:hypothetical protein